MSKADRETAIHWYCHCGYMLSTIAQHFGMTEEELKAELHTEGK